MQCCTRGAVQGTRRKVANNDMLSDSEDKSTSKGKYFYKEMPSTGWEAGEKQL